MSLIRVLKVVTHRMEAGVPSAFDGELLGNDDPAQFSIEEASNLETSEGVHPGVRDDLLRHLEWEP